jgi:23S rRNA (adenine2030-N6)-methyltransferase
MNYRHIFHAGNFADLAKHAILTRILTDLTAQPAPLTVIDTHAGAGLYDLTSDLARKTGEGEAGIVQLARTAPTPSGYRELLKAVGRANAPGGGVRYYPGSPVIIVGLLRARDRYEACELRPEDQAALKQVLPREAGAVVHLGDGWVHATSSAPAAPAALFLLVDPPFERGDDYVQSRDLVETVMARNPLATIAIWVPLKDLATFDAFLGDIEDAAGAAPILAAEVRLRPLHDPMRLNGCAMVVINPPDGLEAHARSVVTWIAETLGEGGALGKVTRIAP